MRVTESYYIPTPGAQVTILSFDETPPFNCGGSIEVDGLSYDLVLVMDMSNEKVAISGEHDLTGKEAIFSAL